jgi:hypothetical protein
MREILHTGAELSPCNRYRYLLWRSWNRKAENFVLFLMLNPSTASALEEDPTIRKCMGFAERWGKGGILVANLFAYRATAPGELLSSEDPVGPDNHAVLERVLNGDAGFEPPSTVVLAWGACGGPKVARLLEEREKAALRVLRAAAPPPRVACLGHTQSGAPRHPLMLAYATPLIPLPVVTTEDSPKKGARGCAGFDQAVKKISR